MLLPFSHRQVDQRVPAAGHIDRQSGRMAAFRCLRSDHNLRDVKHCIIDFLFEYFVWSTGDESQAPGDRLTQQLFGASV